MSVKLSVDLEKKNLMKISLFNNVHAIKDCFMVCVHPSSYGCTWEVAKHCRI